MSNLVDSYIPVNVFSTEILKFQNFTKNGRKNEKNKESLRTPTLKGADKKNKEKSSLVQCVFDSVAQIVVGSAHHMEQVVREAEMVPQGVLAQLSAAPPEVQRRYVKPGTAAVVAGTKYVIEETLRTVLPFRGQVTWH